MFFIIGIYFILVLFFVAMYFFIVYHFVKYSINSSLNKILLPLFIIISTLLLLSNIMLFFSIDWSGLLSKLTISL